MDERSSVSSFPENSSRLINSPQEPSTSHHPSERPPPSCSGDEVFFGGGFQMKVGSEKKSETASCFPPSLYYFNFWFWCVSFFFPSFLEEGDSSRWRRATSKPKLRRWRMIYLLPLLYFPLPGSSPPPCSPRLLQEEQEEEEEEQEVRRG